MKTARLLALLSIIFCATHLFAQKKVVLEKLRCYSTSGPVMSYFRDAATRQLVAAQLYRVLQNFHGLHLVDTTTLTNIEFLSAPDKAEKVTLFTDNDTSVLHLYLDVFEIDPVRYFMLPGHAKIDSLLRLRTRSIFLLEASIVRPDKSVLFNEDIHIAISAAPSNGMGLLYRYLTTQGVFKQVVATPKGFTELLKAATRILFDPDNNTQLVEMKVAPAFIGDDFILNISSGHPRVFVSTAKNISRYIYRDTTEMTRMGEAMYEDITINRKNAKTYSENFIRAIEAARDRDARDFVFLRQECRDVTRDKTYSLQFVSQIRPSEPSAATAYQVDFLPGDFHYLLHDADTLARFSVRTRLAESAKKISLHKISNGIDSGSVFTMPGKSEEQSLQYGFIVNGKIGAQSFAIKCGGINANSGYPLREIYLADKLACIAQGEFYPEKFVVFDASLSSELLNQLLMIGFNRFFE